MTSLSQAFNLRGRREGLHRPAWHVPIDWEGLILSAGLLARLIYIFVH